MNKRLLSIPLTLSALALVGVTAALTLSSRATPVLHPHMPAAIPASAAHANSAVKQDSAAHEGKDDDGETEDDSKLTASISPAQAAAAATAYLGGTTANAPELEDEDGVAVYGVAVTATDGKKYDVKVDANTGKVLKSEADDDDKEDAEEDAKGEANDVHK